MSRSSAPTAKEIERNFKHWLKKAMTEGLNPPSETGMDHIVLRAIERVASSWPAINERAVVAARQALSDQLDGTHARNELAEWDAYLREKLNG